MRKSVFVLLLIAGHISIAFSQQFEVIAPQTFVSGRSFPIAIEVNSNNQLDLFYSGTLALTASGVQIPDDQLRVRKGRGMAMLQSDGGNSLTVNSGQFSVSPQINQTAATTHSGSLSGSQTWSAQSVNIVTSNLTIESGDTLTIEAGSWVLLNEDVNITVNGHLNVLGLSANPVVFTSNELNAWGGLLFATGSGTLNFCLINNGGGDDSQWFGHSDSQPVVMTTGGQVTLKRCFIFDCPGKALGAISGRLNFSNGGISRCDTGGEFGSSYAEISGSHVLEIPDADGLLEDDDNDGFYFFGTNAENIPNVVDSCVFMIGEDDGIDHNGAILEVKNCWVEGFANEGVATSNQNTAYIYNSLFKNCEQGIEAGYGSPTVTVDHCVMVENDYGLRFGDWYNWGCSGTINCTNSIMLDNTDNVYNFDVLSNGPITGAIDITHSIPSDTEFDGNTGNVIGVPIFDNQYQLEPGSVGIGAASDGLNMGLVSSTIIGITEPLVAKGKPISFQIYDLSGKLVHKATGVFSTSENQQHLTTGIYIIRQDFEQGSVNQKIAILK